MKLSRFEDILNDCLDRLAQGETVEECLARYPEVADGLAPLLHIARATQQLASSMEPRPQAKQAIQERLGRAWRARAERRPKIQLVAWFRPAAVALALVAFLGLTGWGTTAAAAGSVPGEPLYPVKLTRERVVLALAFSSERKARHHVALANERAMELEALVRRKEPDHAAERLAERVAFHANTAVLLVTREELQVPAAPPGPGGPAIRAKAPLPAPSPAPSPQTQAPAGLQKEAVRTAPADAPRPVAAKPSREAKPVPSERAEQKRLRQEIRQMLKERARQRQEQMEEALKEVPLAQRPRLRYALEQSHQAFLEALRQLEQAEAQEQEEPVEHEDKDELKEGRQEQGSR